jgi:hypothetical protein
MSKFSSVTLAAVLGVAMLGTAGTEAMATPKRVTAAPAAQEHCVLYLSKERDAHGLSKVLSRQCSAVSEQAALAGVRAEVRALRPDLAAKDPVALFTEYRDQNYLGGQLYTMVGGESCDRAGYTLRNYGSVANNVSSIWGYGTCNHSLLTDGAPPWTEYQDLPTPYVGERLEDDIDYVHAYYA